MTAATSTAVEAAILALFADADTDVCLHAVDLESGDQVAIAADRPVAAASVFKVQILVSFMVDAHTGRIDPEERIVVSPDQHVPGSTGLSVFSDPAELSLRDLAMLMITVSDNTAADLILERVGMDRVNRLTASLGLEDTALVSTCADILGELLGALDPAMVESIVAGHATLSDIDGATLDALSIVDPNRTNRTTVRDMTTLLRSVWLDQIDPASACAQTREVMAKQVWPHRLASGVPDGTRYAGKTGTLPAIRNEVGVVTPYGSTGVAIAVSTRAHDHRENRPDIDRAIGEAGRLAVEALLGRVPSDPLGHPSSR